LSDQEELQDQQAMIAAPAPFYRCSYNLPHGGGAHKNAEAFLSFEEGEI